MVSRWGWGTRVSLWSLALLASCGEPQIYAWGHYEDSVYRLGRRDADFNPDEEIAILTEDVRKAVTAGRLVPPGLYMHLGYLHSLKHDSGAAVKYFRMEKEAFPESSVFVEGVIARLATPKP